MEPEWDDDTRAWAEGLADHDRAVCRGCGLHTNVTHDPHSHLQMVDDYCPACRFLEAYKRKVADRDTAWEKQHPQAKPGEPRPNDGLHLAMRQATPAEVRAGQRALRRREQQQDGQPSKTPKQRLNRRG